jgi:hypothetical protein
VNTTLLICDTLVFFCLCIEYVPINLVCFP